MIFAMPIHPSVWYRKVDLLVISLDDFEMIIGMDFLKAIKTTILSHLGGLLIMDREPYAL